MESKIMGIFPRILESRSRERKVFDATSDHWYEIVSPTTKTGLNVNERSSIKYLTVFACVSLIAGDLARLPLILYRRIGNGKERALDHPLYGLLHDKPNPETSSYHWRESGQGHASLWGNHYSIIKRTNLTGQIKGIWQIDDPGRVNVKRDQRTKRIYYEWKDQFGKHYKKSKREILHIPGFSFNGLVGLSNIAIAREAVSLGLSLEEFGSRFFGDGMNMSGVISMDKDLGNKEKDYMKALKEQYAGLGKAHGVMVLQNGEKYERLAMPLEDAQFIESRKFQKTEICGMFHVPPHKIGVHGQNSNRNNLEQENQSYVDSCLMHWFGRWESCLNMQLLTDAERREGYFFEFLVDGMLRGDTKARAEYYTKRWGIGSITANEIRNKENENPIEGGDIAYVPLNYIPADQSGQDQTEENSRRHLIRYRSIISRDRIIKRYYPLIANAAQDIVNHEAIIVKRKVDELQKERAVTDFDAWMKDFYRSIPAYIKRKIGPVFRSFSDAVKEATARELGLEDEINLEAFVNGYLERYIERHVNSSQGQLEALSRDEDLAAIEMRVDEWTEKRSDKIAKYESVRMSNAVYQFIAFGVGLATYWRTRGKETCPYCRSLAGKKVRSGQSFVNDGDELNPEGAKKSLKVYGRKTHPPLHQDCDCYLSAE